MKQLLIFAIFVLSINAIAQSKHSIFNSQHPTTGSLTNVQGVMEDKEWQVSTTYFEKNQGQAIKNNAPQERSLIQIYDSIYEWQWDTPSSGWKFAFKFTNIVYDENNNMISEIEQYWNDNAWMNYMHYTYTYDSNNNRTSELEQQYWNGSTWENDEKDTYTYDASNNLTSELYYDWNNSIWIKEQQYIYSYDAENFTISTSYKIWDDDGTEVIESDSTHYYFHTIVGINKMPEYLESISVYPNPSSTTITIELPSTTPVNNTTLAIYTVNAQQVLSREITEPMTLINVGTLPRGVYFVKVTDNKMVMMGKFVKQ